MSRSRRARLGLTSAVLALTLSLTSCASAPNVDEGFGESPEPGLDAPTTTVVMRCGRSIAEDEAAHVRLIDFTRDDYGNVTLKYRCTHAGY